MRWILKPLPCKESIWEWHLLWDMTLKISNSPGLVEYVQIKVKHVNESCSFLSFLSLHLVLWLWKSWPADRYGYIYSLYNLILRGKCHELTTLFTDRSNKSIPTRKMVFFFFFFFFSLSFLASFLCLSGVIGAQLTLWSWLQCFLLLKKKKNQAAQSINVIQQLVHY